MLTLIRTDASSAIGLGHMRRCLSLAAALRAAGAEVRFGVRAGDVGADAVIAGEGFDARVLPTLANDDVVADADAFVALWPGALLDWVVVDHYRLDAAWHARVRERLGCRLAVIDDLADRALSPDMLIDHNFVPAPDHRSRYAQRLVRESAVSLYGPHFALLGPAYQAPRPFEVSRQVRSVGIFLGGTDPAALSATALRACRTVAGFTGPVEVVSTSANPGLARLRESVAQDPAACLSVDLPDLSDFFSRHDLQVGAGGGATWERCCVGVPTLTLRVADNQRVVITGLQALGALVSTTDNGLQAIGQALKRLIASPDERQSLSDRSRALVDGRGAQRVALAMVARTGDAPVLRAARPEDARMLWHWRNDPATRAVSRQPGEITWPDHQAWLADTLANSARRLWVAHVNQVPVGVIRFDALPNGRHEVSLYLDPGLHGLGLGARLLEAGEQALALDVGAVTVHAEVLADNPASVRLFTGAGYRAESALTFFKTVLPKAAAASVRQGSQP